MLLIMGVTKTQRIHRLHHIDQITCFQCNCVMFFVRITKSTGSTKWQLLLTGALSSICCINRRVDLPCNFGYLCYLGCGVSCALQCSSLAANWVINIDVQYHSVQQDCLSIEGADHPRMSVCNYVPMTFCCCDFDFDPMILIHVYTNVTYILLRRTCVPKMKCLGQCFRKLEHELYRQTHRERHRQTRPNALPRRIREWWSLALFSAWV